MMKPKVDATDNMVMIEGHLMTRPRRLTRNEWLDFWNRAMDNDDELKHQTFKEGYELGYRDGEEDFTR